MTKTRILEQYSSHAALSSERESCALSLNNRKWKWTQISTKCETMFNLNFHLLHFKRKLGSWTSVTQVFKICTPILCICHSAQSPIWPQSVYQSLRRLEKNVYICLIDRKYLLSNIPTFEYFETHLVFLLSNMRNFAMNLRIFLFQIILTLNILDTNVKYKVTPEVTKSANMRGQVQGRCEILLCNSV